MGPVEYLVVALAVVAALAAGYGLARLLDRSRLTSVRSQAEETVTLPARAYAELPNVTRYWLSPSTGTAAVSRCE